MAGRRRSIADCAPGGAAGRRRRAARLRYPFPRALCHPVRRRLRCLRGAVGRQAVDEGRTESTATLLGRVRAGDPEARERLVYRYLPLLRRWARGRLPQRARDLHDTEDIVHLTLIAALERIDVFESRREGAFLAYLRAALMNQVRMELRRVGRGGEAVSLPEQLPAVPIEGLSVDDALDYERALSSLSDSRREALILRFEFGMSFAEVAAATDRPSAEAAQMLVSRAVLDLARALGR